MTVKRLPLLLAFAVASLFALQPAAAVTSTFKIFIDSGNDNAATSCSDPSVPFRFDEVLTTTVDTSGPASASVTALAHQTCLAGVLDPTPDPVPGPPSPPWNVGIGNGDFGTNVVETFFKFTGTPPTTVRLALVATGATGGLDLVTTTATGGQTPIVLILGPTIDIPTLGTWGLLLLALLLTLAAGRLLRRRGAMVALALVLFTSAGALWAVCLFDGLTNDWSAGDRVAQDNAGDSAGGPDVRSLYAKFENGSLCFRIDTSLITNTKPMALDDSYSTNEDTPLSIPAPGVLGNDSDIDPGQTLTAVLVTGPSNAASFALAADGSFNYTPVADFNGTDSFMYHANDGFEDSADVTVTITVAAVNDAPIFTKGPDQSVLQGAGAQTVNPWATGISPGPPDESAQTVAFNVTGNTNPSLFSVAPAISPSGVLTYTPAAAQVGSSTITIDLQDNGGTANGGVDTSAPQTFTITVVDVNDPPSFTAGPDQTVLEDAGAQTVNPWATAISPGPPSESGQTVAFNVTNNTDPALFSAGPAISPTGVLTYTPAANANGAATITITLQDNGGTASGGVDTSPPQSFTITVTAVNDPPTFTKGPDQTVNEDAGAQTVNPWATAISPGPADESGQTVSFNVTGNTNAALFSIAPAISPTGTLTYTPAANASGSATITITLQDNGGTANGGADTSAAQTFTITVTGVNDPPSFTAGPDQTVNEDAGAQTVNPWATAISPGPPGEAGQTVTFQITANTNAALFSAGPAVSPTGVLTYTPAANANGVATITLRLMDNGGTANGGVDVSPTQSFTITVNSVNDAPSFTAGPNQSVNEDSGAQTVNPWATAISPGPANESGQTVAFNITGNTNAALFSVAPAVSPTGVLTYTPAANASGAATISLTLQDNGGTANGGVDTSAPQSFTITVNAVNDAPSFTAGPNQTVNEDAGAQTVNPWATAISPGPPSEAGQTVAFNVTGNTNAALFSAGPAVSPTGVLTYTPAANAFGVATITLTLQDNGGTANGGIDTSAAQSFTITVNSVNDAPSFTAGPNQTINEDSGAQTVNPWATAISPGPANESGQTVSFNITGNTNAGLFSVAPAVSPTGVLTYTPVANTSGSATITLNVMDNGGTANGGIDTSAGQSFTITVNAVNDAPSFTAGPNQTVNEDAGAQTVNPWATAISPGPPSEAGQTVAFNVTGNTNAGLFSAGPAISPTGVLTYTPAANAFGSATITITLQDNGGTANGGIDTSAPQSFTITVNAVNDVPSFTAGPNQTVFEDAGAQTVNPWATAISVGPANESGQTITFQVTANSNPGLFSAGPAISPTGVLTYTPTANTAGVATIMVQVMDNGGTANGGVDTSATQAFTITVTGINDAPSFLAGPNQTVNEDSGPQTVNPWATAISAGPPDESGQTLTFIITANTNTGLFSAGPAVSPTGVLTYTSAPNAFGSATVTLRIMDNGGTANGGVDTSATQSFTITVNPVNDPPTAGLDSFEFIGNTELRVDQGAVATPHVLVTTGTTFGVLDNDIDSVELDPIAVTSLTVGACMDNSAPFDCTDATVGTVHLLANGRFSFEPAPGDAGATETFTYVVSDNGVPAPASATGTVNLTRKGRVWYVKNDQAAGGLGRSFDPFDTLVEAEPLSVAGDTIYVYNGNGTTTGQANGIVLKNTQRLIGEGVQLTLPVTVNGGPNPTVLRAAGTTPMLDDTDAGGNAVGATDAIPLEIAGLNLAGNTNGIDITTAAAFAGSGSTEIRNNTIRATGIEGIDVNAAGTGTLDLSIHDNTITAGVRGIDVLRTAGTCRITAFQNNAISGNTGGSGIEISSVIFDAVAGNPIDTVTGGTTVIGASGNGVSTNGMLLTSVTGDLSFTDLDIFNDAGAGLFASSTGALNAVAGTGFRIAVGAGVSTIDSNGGPVVSINNASISLPINFLRSTNSTTTGLSLVSAFGGVGSTALSAGSGQIADPVGASGTAVNISGGNGNITLGIPIINTSGNSVAVASRTSDTVSFTGAITESGSGISLTTNPGATMSFSGGITASTGSSPAFTATGPGPLATSGGTVNVTGAANTLTTATGTALNVAHTTIGASGLTFRSIAANGAASGIVLNNTGTTGGLTVAGTGATGTGGTIQNCTGDGISFTSTRNVNLSWMNITGSGNNGIFGSSVTNLSLSNLKIQNNTNALTEAGLKLANIFGVNTVTSTEVSGSTEDNVNVTNSTNSSTLTSLTFSGAGCSIHDNSVASGNVGINIQSSLTADMNGVVIDGCEFQGNRTVAIRGDAADSSQLDITVKNNVITAGAPNQGNQGIEISSATTAQVTFFDIDNNKVGTNGVTPSPLLNTGINVSGGGASGCSMTGRVRNNTVVNAGAGMSGFGIRVFQSSSCNIAANVANNTVSNVGLDYGLLVESGGSAGSTGRVDAAVTNNNVTVLAGALDAVRAQARNASTMCARITGNTTTHPNDAGCDAGSTFCGLVIRQANTAAYSLEGSGAACPAGVQMAAQAETCVESLNSEDSGEAFAATNFTGVATNFCTNIP